MSHTRAVAVVAVVCLAASVPALFACRGGNDLRSNFSEVTLGERQILAHGGGPYTGTLVAHGDEIVAVARTVLVDLVPAPSEFGTPDGRGLILVLPVKDGVADGTAALYVDLRSSELRSELSDRRDQLALTLAESALGTFKVAEATFVKGQLEGPATIMAPSPRQPTRLTKVAELPFHKHRLHGLVVQYFPGTTQKRTERTVVDGMRSGPDRTYHASGKVARQATYVGGSLHGEITEHYASGALRERATYERGRLVGKREAWYPGGERWQEEIVEGGVTRLTEWYSNGGKKREVGPDGEVVTPPEGLVVEYHDSGAVRSRITYVAGVPHGDYEFVYDDGQKWERGRYVEGKLEGSQQKWWKNGKLALECTWRGGLLEGPLRRWYDDGTPWEEATYVASRPTGAYKKWWRNGKLAHAYAYAAPGQLQGPYRTFYDNGKPWAQAEYVNGRPRGKVQRWFPDGKLGYVMEHDEHGRPHGVYKRWWSSGKPRLEATHANGRLDGEFKNWLEDGTVYELATYERGRKVKSTRE